MAMDRYVKRGLELAWDIYFLMAEGEELVVDRGSVSCPSYNSVPDGMLIHGLFTPVTLSFSMSQFTQYMELLPLNENNEFGDKMDESDERIYNRNVEAYVWFAENGHSILSQLAQRRNDATVCIRLPQSIKERLEEKAREKKVKLSDLLRNKVQELLAG